MYLNKYISKIILLITILPNILCCKESYREKSVNRQVNGTEIVKGKFPFATSDCIFYAVENGQIYDFCCILKYIGDKGDYLLVFDQIRTCNANDTTICDNHIAKNMHIKATYKQQVVLMKMFIKKILISNNPYKLKYIDYPLLTSGELNIEIQKIIIKSGDSLEEAIVKSKLYTDINYIIQKYDLYALKKAYIEKYCYVDKEIFIENNEIDSLKIAKHNKFIDCNASFKIKRK